MFRRLFRYSLFASAFTLGGLLAWEAVRVTVDGSGVPATQERVVGPVKEVVLSGVGNVTITQGDVPSLTVTADDNLLQFLETETAGNRLTISTRSGYSLRPKGPMNYALTVPHLEKVTISGSGNVTVGQHSGDELAVRISGSGRATLRDLTCRSLAVTLSGSGGATAAGSAGTTTLKISGSGDIDASALKAKTAEAQISGSGTLKVWATDELNARISGSGGVKYRGSPKVEKKVSGSGSVKPLEG